MEVSKKIQLILKNLPASPGVYQMYNDKEEIIYIGKAKDLKKRVRSYFRKQKNTPIKVKKMVSQISTIKYTEVESELEALVLETNYIKQYRPRFNILMRDDKHYNYIKVTTNEDYPRVYTTRKVLKDGALYFGPKTSGASLQKTLKLLRKLFPYRTCTLDIEDRGNSVLVKKKTIKIPCIYYHIHRCMGPCIVPCKKEYNDMIKNISGFLEGNYTHVTASLKEKMLHCAKERKFEKAMKMRDLIQAIENLMEKQIVDQAECKSQDAIALSCKFGKAFVHLFQVREGKVIGQENFVLNAPHLPKENTTDIDIQKEVIASFLLQYYSATTSFPEEILLPIAPENATTLQEWFLRMGMRKSPKIIVPKQGIKRKLIELSYNNAVSYAEQNKIEWMTEHAKTKGAAKDLAEALELQTELQRIECYDISHLSGTHTVGSMVVFKHGSPSKKDYRRFKVQTVKENDIDDYKSLQEVLLRRLKKIKQHIEVMKQKKSDDSFEEIPDLIIIDGGKGQLSHVMEVAEDIGIEVPIISLAKREEEIFVPGSQDPILLPRKSNALYLIQNIRDEAHRFAITYNKNLRSKSMVKSRLDEIPGIGPTTKKKLLQHFGDIKGITHSSEATLAEIVGEKLAHTIKEYL